MNFIKNSCIRIPIVFKEEAWFQQIISELKRTEADYNDPNNISIKKYYEVRDGNLLVPRFYPIHKFGHECTEYLNPPKLIPEYIKFKSKWKNDLQYQGSRLFTEEDNGVLCMQPGEGKTVVTIGSVCELRVKTIIYVHKDSLVSQWKERFLEHTTIADDDIGILRTAKCYDLLEKPIVLSTVQTMVSMIKSIDDIEKIIADAGFGMAVWDECHTSISAEGFSKTSLYMPCKKIYGLSATPRRGDGNTDIINMHAGEIYVPAGSGDTLDPRIIMLYFAHGAVANHRKYIYSYKDPKTKQWIHRFDKSRYLAMLTSKKNEKYIDTMKKIVENIYRSGRKALFLTDRIKILDRCSKIIKNKNHIGFFLPRSGKERDNELMKPFVFSTYGSARDGTDRKDLDCLVMATNTGNLEQCIGRIVRASMGKKEPVVFDCVDTECEEMMSAAEYRKKYYEEKGWKLEERHLK